MVRKLRESTFTTIAFEEIEDEEYAKDTLKEKKLIRFSYTVDITEVNKIPVAQIVGNMMLKKLVKPWNIFQLLLSFMPKNTLIAEQEDGFFRFETCLADTMENLEKILTISEKTGTKILNIYTNAEIDSLFTKICGERGINIFTF